MGIGYRLGNAKDREAETMRQAQAENPTWRKALSVCDEGRERRWIVRWTRREAGQGLFGIYFLVQGMILVQIDLYLRARESGA